MVSLSVRLRAFRRKNRVTVSQLATLLGMTSREYRSLESGTASALPLSALPVLMTGIERRLSMRTTGAAYRARKNDERSKTRADARAVKRKPAPRVRVDI